MDIAQRIGEIIKHFGLSSSSFSDKVGVQRSTLSHILSGRNKPSFDFVQKVLQNFPELNPNWLLTGKHGMLQTSDSPKLDLRFANTNEKENPIKEKLPLENSNTQSNATGKKVKMVMICYTDGTFEQFTS